MNSSITGNGVSHIYYNITLTNNDTSDTHFPPPISFTETRNSPFLNCPEDYFMSVVRFQLDTPTLPVMTCQPLVGSALDVDTLIYRVWLRYKTTTVGVNIVFVPQNSFSAKPVGPLSLADQQSEYFNIYNYQWFIDMLNTTLTTAFNDLHGNIPPGASAPFFGWDTGGNVAILQQNILNENYGVNQDSLEIYFNTPLYTLFNSFIFTSGYVPNITPDTVGHKLYVETGLNAIVSSITPYTGGTAEKYFNMVQEYSTVPLWTPIDSIVFTTSMLPLTPELQAAPVSFNTKGVFESIGANANLTTVLTDFIVPLTTGGEYKPSINYTPTAEYRLVDLFGTSPINSIQVNVFYKNRFGTLIPLLLGSGCNASIKIMFRRKDFANMIIN